ncbi:MAG TPA: PIN domain-containing protein [Thermomicrobiales bacterium]|nr:PIN domain-containing protein [Thermomicrobiales bacterium]
MSDSILPRRVFLDSGVVVAAIIPGSQFSSGCGAFCDRLIAEGCEVYFSQILRLELTEAIRKLATIPGRAPADLYSRFRLNDWDRNPSVRRQWMHFGVRQFDALLERFAVVYELPFRPPIWLRSVEIMADRQLRSHDAVHLATAYEYRLATFATTDDEFLKVPNLDIRLIRDPAA